MPEWTKPGAATAVSVALTLTVPASGLPADMTAGALAIAYDANGEVVFKRGVGDATVKALLTATQKQQLAAILAALHTEAVTRLVT